MTMPAEIVDRLEALVLLLETGVTVSPRYECRISPNDLPTFVILAQGATRERIGARGFRTSRDFLLLLLIEKVADDKLQNQQEARERAYAYLDSVPRFFAARPYLELDGIDMGLSGVVGTTLPREEGVQLTSWGGDGDTFTAIPFRMTITSADEV